ncbi:MAG: type II secretion system protein [Oscillospiraceae bacterium]|nr:type II secretion system protein [Oscillospiraceae bacterium]
MHKKMGNGGFTLVELLVAVLILAIITAPLIHAFVTSSRTFVKSRDIGEATQAAENLAETVEATPVGSLAALIAGGKFSTGTVDSLMAEDYVYRKDASGNYLRSADGTLIEATGSPTAHTDTEVNASRYTLALSDVTEGSSTFHAEVELDAKPYAEENLTKITEYTAMDAVFSQPSGSDENPDFLASNAFLNEAVALSGQTLAADYFDHAMKRSITIQVTQDGGEYIATAAYVYSCLYAYTATTVGDDGVVKTENRTTTLSADYSYEFYRRDTAPVSLYVFFFPNYNTALAQDDDITILNQNDLTFLMFLIKQKAETWSGDMADVTLNTYETAYSAVVSLKESVKSSRPHASVYSNISRNVSEINTNPDVRLPVTFRVFYGNTWYLPDSLLEDLVGQEEENRLYQVTITLYDEDGYEVYSMQSAKLD